MNQPTFTPEAGGNHYGKTQPFHLTRAMESSGNAHVDGCRCSIIKYAFRIKGKAAERVPKLIDDLRKAAHYATEAADTLAAELAALNQPELPFAEGPQDESRKDA